MADSSRARPFLIVTGSSLRAEDADRPLAYYLKQQVENHPDVQGHDADGPAVSVHVLSDFRWINDDEFHGLPTVSLGGPGVNALAHRWLEELPVTLAVDEQFVIQLDPDFDVLRASIWGMDNASTQIAVSVFIARYLPDFLRHVAELDDDAINFPAESDDDDDDD